MAKDGTARGGARVHSGPMKKSLAEKIVEGKAVASLQVGELPEAEELETADMPPVEEYMKAHQQDGIELRAEEIFRKVWLFLRKYGCESKVNIQLINQYSMATARWIQCETAISAHGMLARHPTTGLPMTSPYVTMSREYNKQMNTIWYQIYQVIRDNSEQGVIGNPQDNLMEQLLLKKKP